MGVYESDQGPTGVGPTVYEDHVVGEATDLHNPGVAVVVQGPTGAVLRRVGDMEPVIAGWVGPEMWKDPGMEKMPPAM